MSYQEEMKRMTMSAHFDHIRGEGRQRSYARFIPLCRAETDAERGVPEIEADGARLALLACVSSTNRNSSLSVEFWGVTKLSVRQAAFRVSK